MNEINDSFLHGLQAISSRVKNELCVSISKKSKLIDTCINSSDKMQKYYLNWEDNMNKTMNGIRKMDLFKELISYNSELRTAISGFNEAINKGKENMGEAKKIWGNKCRKIYRDLDIKNHGVERVSENVDTSIQVMSEGSMKILSIAQTNYKETKTACIDVFTEYNTAIKLVPKKVRKKLLCKKIIITSEKLGSFIGKLPRK